MRRGTGVNLNKNMGKRLVLLLVIITSVSTSFLTRASKEPIQGDFQGLYGSTVHAQEALTAKTAKTITANDSVREMPTVSKKTRAVSKTSSKELVVVASAYSSSPDETDDTPFITASGSFVHDGIAAANFLPIGTQFMIPDMFGDKVFTVEDRMNERYNNSQVVDIWVSSKEEALNFGRKVLNLQLL